MNDDSLQLLPNDYEIDTQLAKTSFLKENYVPDHMSRIFNNDVEINKDSIFRLNSSIVEKCKTHGLAGLLTSVDIKFENRKSLHFGMWNDFYRYDWEETAPISNIVITWAFNLVVPEMPIPQKHSLTVKLSNGIKTEEMLNLIFSGNLSEVTEIENNFFPVVAQCVYVQRSFGNELLGIVSNWVDSISRPTWAGRSILKFLKKHKSKISLLIQFLTKIIILLGTLYAFLTATRNVLPENIRITSTEEIITILHHLGLLLVFWQLTNYISRWFGKTIYNIIDNYGHSFIFSITKKDIERRDKMQKQNFYDKIKLGLVVLGDIATNVFFIFLDRLI